MDKRFISDLKVNEAIDSVFLLRKKNRKLTKYEKPYLEMTFADKTGKIEARLWDDVEDFDKEISVGDIVRVKGSIDEYRGEKQFKVDYIAKAEKGSFAYEDMIRVAEEREKIFKNVLNLLKSIQNKWIALLVDEFILDKVLMSQLIDGVGGKSWHNAYIGGLVEHTYEVMYIVNEMCKLYPETDRDVALFGGFIHDIGKVSELDAKNLEYTIEGGLLGHIAIGHKILLEKIKNISDFPKELSLRLEHTILSHHGEYEQQSPVLPKTLEAVIVYQTDELVSQTNAIKEIKSAQAEEGRAWSDYISIKNRKYFIKDSQKEPWKSN